MGTCFQECYQNKKPNPENHNNDIENNKLSYPVGSISSSDEDKIYHLTVSPIIVLSDKYYDEVKSYITCQWQNIYSTKRDAHKSRTASYFTKYAKHPIFFEKLIKKKSENKDKSIVPDLYMQQNEDSFLAEVIKNTNTYNHEEYTKITDEILKIQSFKYLKIDTVLDSWIRAFFLDALDEFIRKKLKKRPVYYKKITNKFPPIFVLFLDEKEIALQRTKSREDKAKSWNVIYLNIQDGKQLYELFKELENFEENVLSQREFNFFCCNKIEHLELLIKQLINENKTQFLNDIKIKYSILIEEKSAKETLDLIENKNYNKYFNGIFVLSDNVEKCEEELKSYKNLKKVFNKNDINTLSDYYIKTQPHSLSIEFDEIITLYKYKIKYKTFRQKIKHYNDKYSQEEYYKHYKNFKKFMLSQSKEQLSGTSSKIGGSLEKMTTEELIDSVKIFGNFESEKIKRSVQLIKEYYSPQNDTLLRYFNYWLRELDNKTYDIISYFISDIIYSLNSYDEIRNKVMMEGEHTWYRGLSMPFSDLLLYKQNEGGIITFPSFTSSSSTLHAAEFFLKNEKEKRKNGIYGILMIIRYNCKKTDIPVVIDIDELTRDKQDNKKDKSDIRIILPFTFYKIRKVDIKENEELGIIELDILAKKKGEHKENSSKRFRSLKSKNKVLLYKINDIEKETMIFGEEFVEMYKNKLKLKIEGKKINLCSKYLFNNYGESTVEIIEEEPITNMKKMFYECENLLSIESIWDMSKITDTSNMFSFCSNLEDIEELLNWDMSNVINTSGMFTGCTNLSNIDSLKNWNMINVIDTSYMFAFTPIKNLEALKNWDTSQIFDMHAMFKNCNLLYSIEPLANWNMSSISDISEMFSGCSSLFNIDAVKNWDIKNVSDTSEMFCNCVSLKSIDAVKDWDIQNITDSRRMFSNCISLTSLEALENWGISNATFTAGMFYKCYGIEKKVSFNKSDITDEENDEMY